MILILKQKQEKKQRIKDELKQLESYAKTSIKTESGLMYEIIKKGSGSKPKVGSSVSVHYSGYLLDGTKFDSSYDRGEPITFPLGQGRVIKGWDEGISLLSKGAKAKFIYSFRSLAYGERGTGIIPPGATLIFEVELVDFK